ncbi:VOC family protein [Hoyosella rhizosphaerae]|uniref:Glyoxalase n=1 Tax=Hoyosella rhizosphaerae TaxID=1755582 RepID=A0A916U1I3_9ACTN|nr:VOC family protein [Hoyosella rhizosphaerae]MBN4926988.1 VOC family protein [Hoyosella rhizosphaerae]GGC54924.1 glyoxalase [Hoyosella rhizosphaerae]
MSTLDRYIPGVPCWADTEQPDPAAAAAFYSGLFGWECENAMPSDEDTPYFVARLKDGDVAAISGFYDGAPQQPTWNTYIWVESADETATKLTEAGGRVLQAPFDVMDQGRMAVCADLEGATFMVWEPRAHRGSAVVNEPGSVNFNDLYTRDPESARRFYNAVFGWEILDLGPGGQMFTLPGYSDHLDLLYPGNTAEMVAMGAPAGFENVVASLSLIDADSDIPPHWGITFAVADADEAAARAAELGGAVVAAPADAPWTRVTVLRDPAGVVFTAGQFVPENASVTS